MFVMLYHPELGEAKNNYGRKFHRDDEEAALESGWSETCPLHPKVAEQGGKIDGSVDKPKAVETPLLEVLRSEYKAATGKDADKRWGEKKLREELKAA